MKAFFACYFLKDDLLDLQKYVIGKNLKFYKRRTRLPLNFLHNYSPIFIPLLNDLISFQSFSTLKYALICGLEFENHCFIIKETIQ